MRGTFALAKPEAAYFHAFNDIEELELQGNCTYHLFGNDIESDGGVSPFIMRTVI